MAAFLPGSHSVAETSDLSLIDLVSVFVGAIMAQTFTMESFRGTRNSNKTKRSLLAHNE